MHHPKESLATTLMSLGIAFVIFPRLGLIPVDGEVRSTQPTPWSPGERERASATWSATRGAGGGSAQSSSCGIVATFDATLDGPDLPPFVLTGRQEYQGATANPEDPRFINKLAAGPMVEEDDKYMVGSFFLVEATREEAQAFADNDPFKKVRSNHHGHLAVPSPAAVAMLGTGADIELEGANACTH